MKNRTLDNITAFFCGLLLFCCIFLGMEALAEEKSTCSQIGGLAEQIMITRQAGIPMDKVVEVMSSDELAVTMVIDAYDSPRFSSQDYIDQAVADFKNKWLLNCYKARKGKK